VIAEEKCSVAPKSLLVNIPRLVTAYYAYQAGGEGKSVAADSGGDFSPFPFSHFPSEHLANLGFGEHVPELDIMGHFIGSEPFSAPFDKLVTAHTTGIRLSNHESLDSLPHVFIRNSRNTRKSVHP
jgi:hypothetical protein